MREAKVDIIIPTYKPGEDLGRLLAMLKKQTMAPDKIIIMNTYDGEELAAGDAEVHNIAKEEFDHGATRNRAVSYSDAEYFICMTQDAVPADEKLIETLISAMDGDVKMAYARQLPKDDAGDIEKITRAFNYPEESCVKTKENIADMGIKAFFASNVCCAYERKTFDELGGFIDKTDFNEDMMYASKLIRSGYAIRYCADAKVFHSHNYTLMQQYRRNKAVAGSQSLHPEYFGDVRSEGEGIKLVRTTADRLCKCGKWYKVPELVLVSGFKYLGYRAGRINKPMGED